MKFFGRHKGGWIRDGVIRRRSIPMVPMARPGMDLTRLLSLLAAIIASGAASAQQVVVLRSSIDCAAYGKQPDGSYVANKDTVLLYSDTTVLKVPKGTPLRKEKDPRAYGEFALKCH